MPIHLKSIENTLGMDSPPLGCSDAPAVLAVVRLKSVCRNVAW